MGTDVGMGINVGESVVDERGRITIPRHLRDKFGLKPGKNIIIEDRGHEIALKPVISTDDFIRELEGCITKENKMSHIDVLKLKEIWGADHDHC